MDQRQTLRRAGQGAVHLHPSARWDRSQLYVAKSWLYALRPDWLVGQGGDVADPWALELSRCCADGAHSDLQYLMSRAYGRADKLPHNVSSTARRQAERSTRKSDA